LSRTPGRKPLLNNWEVWLIAIVVGLVLIALAASLGGNG
jgi:hypothetical protein